MFSYVITDKSPLLGFTQHLFQYYAQIFLEKTSTKRQVVHKIYHFKADAGRYPSPGATLISSPVNNLRTSNVSSELYQWASKEFSISSEFSGVSLSPGISSLIKDNKLSGMLPISH